MNIFNKEDNNFSIEEIEKAEILEAYTRKLKGESLSRFQVKLLESPRYEKELIPLKRLINYTHHQAEKETFSHVVSPRTGAVLRVKTKILELISDREGRSYRRIWRINPISVAPVYSPEQIGSDSTLEVTIYEEPIESPVTNGLILKFQIIEGDEKGQKYSVPLPELVIGKGHQANVKLVHNPKASNKHAQIISYDKLYIVDLNSNNGTFVDGKRISEYAQLSVGSKIGIGNQEFEITEISYNSLKDSQMALKLKDPSGQEYKIAQMYMTLGRGDSAGIKLKDSSNKMSRIHSKLDVRNGSVYITDLDSTNGTYINGVRITKSTKLFLGSIVKLGGIILKILSIEKIP